MNTSRIAELLNPFLRAPIAGRGLRGPSNLSEAGKSDETRAGEQGASLSLMQLQHISTYIDILLRWNARINLTAIRDPEEIVTRHFGESLFAARHMFPVSSSSLSSASSVAKDFEFPRTVADVGSGAGFPGLPIKIWTPAISLTLIESNHKKCTFLHEVARALTLTDINIQNVRAETLTTTFDVATLRAVERFESILPTAAALVAPAGRLVLLISSNQQNEARLRVPDLIWSDASPIPHSQSRVVLVGYRSDTASRKLKVVQDDWIM